MRWVEGRIERSETIAASIAEVWSVVSSLERLEKILPGIESMRRQGEHTLLVLAEQGAAGISVRPRATVQILFDAPAAAGSASPRIRIEEARGDRDTARVQGVVEFGEQNGGTTARAALAIAIALPIPFFTVPIARAITQRRIDQIADQLLANVRQRAEAGSRS